MLKDGYAGSNGSGTAMQDREDVLREYKDNTRHVGELEGLPEALQQRIQDRVLRKVGGTTISRVPPPIFHPAYQITTLNLPKTIEEKDTWRRHYYRYNPYVSRAVDMHVTFPLSDFSMRCDDPLVQEEYEEIKENINLTDFIQWLAQEYWVSGEAIPYGWWEEDSKSWSSFVLLNPVYVDIEWNPLFANQDETIKLVRWAPSLQRIVDRGRNDPETGVLFQRLYQDAADVIDCIQNKKAYTLDPSAVSHIFRKCSYFDIRGTGIIDHCFDALMYRDKLRQSQEAVADRHINVSEFHKLGSDNEPATEDEYQMYESLLLESMFSGNRVIIWNHALDVQMEGASGRMLPLQGEYAQYLQDLAAGLRVTLPFLMGQGTPYATASVALDVAISEYLPFRSRLEEWMTKNVFTAIAKSRKYQTIPKKFLQGRYRVKGYKPELILPTFVWDKQNLRDSSARLNWLTNLAQQGRIPWRMVYEEANIDPEEVAQQLEDQAKDDRQKALVQASEEGAMPGDLAGLLEGGGGGGLPVDVGGPPDFSPEESFETLGEGESPLERETTEAEAPVLELG